MDQPRPACLSPPELGHQNSMTPATWSHSERVTRDKVQHHLAAEAVACSGLVARGVHSIVAS